MNIAKYSLDNPKVIYFFLFVMLIGGVISFGSLGKKEDSPFVIKTAVLITQYPGASPKEVEQLITEPIEREIQSMRRVYKIKSDSYYGMSKINIELSPATPPEEMPQMWDELRRKVLNVQSQLPQGASDIKVSDDFGDVFGIYFSLTADEGFSYEGMGTTAENRVGYDRRCAEGGPVRRTDRGGQCFYFYVETGQFGDQPEFVDADH